MEMLQTVLPILLLILGSVLLVVLIILGIRLIQIVNRANIVIDDLEKKSKSLDSLFNIIDHVTDAISLFSDKIVESTANILSKMFKKRKKKTIKEEEYE